MKRVATKKHRERWGSISNLGCAVCGYPLAEIHHCFTGGGGRKNHDHTIGLCYNHHRGKEGIHTIGRKTWQAKYGSEQDLLDKINLILGE